MRAALLQFRRAPGRIVVSIVAIALAVGAIGVLAVPAVATSSLDAAVERGGLADIVVATTSLGDDDLASITAITGVTRAERSVERSVVIERAERTGTGTDHSTMRLVGLELEGQQLDLLEIRAGTMPTGPRELVGPEPMGALGDVVIVDEVPFVLVGHGSALWWSGDDALYTDLDSALDPALASSTVHGGANRLAVTAAADELDELRRIGAEVSAVLAASGGGFLEFPTYLPDGSTPIEADIEQVSSLIGLLGIVAGLVALVLLASTTSTLVTERTREVAVMRALGGRSRQLRRRLRRTATAITLVALAIGLPLGVLVSNLIARMVLEEFVGLTPDLAVDWRVLLVSAAGMLIGTRVVSAHAARSVARQPLAEALRDRDGSPYGGRFTHRLLGRLRLGGLSTRLATRATAHHPVRTAAVLGQVAAAVGAVFLIASVTTSVTAYNTAASDPWLWGSVSVADDPGLPLAAGSVLSDPTSEPGIWTEGEVAGWQVDVYGMSADTRFFDPKVRHGSWIEPGLREVVVSAGFAERNDIAVGDQLAVELARGPVVYSVVGTSDDGARTLYLDREVLAGDLGAPGMANLVWTHGAIPPSDLPVAITTSTAADVAAESAAGRDAIVFVFGAIGAVVAGVAGLAVTSSLSVGLYRRRHELAVMQALGARRRALRGVVAREVLPVGLAGALLGLAIGAWGASAIIGAFEASNSVEIGVVHAMGVIPFIGLAAVGVLVLLVVVVVRQAARRPVTVTLRGAA